jgi:beta-1,4-N-acetylglucosaminyltransferase
LRVFASVGTHPQQFDRLLRQLDVLAGGKKHKVFAQTGNCSFSPKNFPFKRFLSDSEYRERIAWADVVVSHGGAGTIINSMLLGKKLVVVPRLKRFGEHTNDHQLDLARALEREGKVIAVDDMSGLGKAVERAASFKPNAGSNKRGLVERLRQFLEP